MSEHTQLKSIDERDNQQVKQHESTWLPDICSALIANQLDSIIAEHNIIVMKRKHEISK